MAATQMVGANSQGKDSDLNQGKYKCCVNKECSVKVCINCYSLYHKSCAERLASFKIIDTSRIVCCEKTTSDKCDTLPDQQQTVKEETWKLEIKYLNKLLSEMEEKNIVLRENNNLLKEKMQHFNDQLRNENVNTEIEGKKATKKNIQTKTLSTFITPNKVAQVTDLNEAKTQEQGREKSNQNIIPHKQMKLSADNTIKTKHSANHGQLQQFNQRTKNMNIPGSTLADLEQKQRRIMTDLINMVPVEPSQDECRTEQSKKDTDAYNWQTVNTKKRSPRRYTGQSEEQNLKFRGVEPKVWMYLSRIAEDVTEDDIREYLKIKTNDKNGQFMVKDLEEPGKRLKSYMVAADFKYKTEFYQPSFWPRGVRYRRFNFKLYEEKYNTRNIIDDTDNPGSFLDMTSQEPVNKTLQPNSITFKKTLNTRTV